MEERRGARIVTQRHLQVEPVPEPSAPSPAPPPEPSPRAGPSLPPADAPVAPSNQGLLERQLRWNRERAKFESSRSADGESK